MAPLTSTRPGWAGDLFDTVLLWVVGALAALAVVVWSGAVVAGMVSGATSGITFPAAAEAVVSLPGNLGDPAAAWPEPARSQLPGPFVYWTGQTVALAGWAFAAQQGWRLWRRLTRRRGALGIETEAGFARPSDLRRLVVKRPQAGRLTLGHAGGRLIAAEPQASLAVLGPSGCGKTAGFAIPALLEWEGPVIVTSVKNDVIDATLHHRQQKGRAWIYDPVGCSGYPSNLWSPVSGCGRWREALRMAAWMCEAAQPRLDTVTDGDYWYSQARKGLSPYIYAAAVSGRGLSDLVRWIDGREVDEVAAALKDAAEPGGPDGARWDELWASSVEVCRDLLRRSGGPVPGYVDAPVEDWPPEVVAQVEETVEAEWRAELEACGHGGDDSLFALGSARALWVKGERLRDSVYATIENVLAEWADPGVRAAGRGSELDPREWLGGDNTVYVAVSAHEQRRLRPV
ncbi:MAG: type IV secretory system conjugative DNA transfer family protein, partial [Actinobacteria bacterium]|nr:type IV secretory system conjugative DNA transfer family protein [Actinomycetota bacterium]